MVSELKESQIHRDKFWLIAAAMCVVAGDSSSKHLEILDFEKSLEYSISYRLGSATIKVLDKESASPVIILVGDVTQCKTMITFKEISKSTGMCVVNGRHFLM